MNKNRWTFFLAMAVPVLVGVIAVLGMNGTDADRGIQERKAEVTGTLEDQFIASQSNLDQQLTVKTVNGLHFVSVQVDRFQETIFNAGRASGTGQPVLLRGYCSG